MIQRVAALVVDAGRQLGLAMNVEPTEDGEPAVRANSLRELAEAAGWARMLIPDEFWAREVAEAMQQVKAIDIGTRGFLFH